MSGKPVPPEKRFWPKVHKTGGCWEWIAALYPTGYGMFSYKQRPMSAHRASYLMFVGNVPDGLYVLHRCDNRKCIRPSHLFLGTPKDNMDDMTAKGRRYSGSKHHAAKINMEIATVIRKRVRGGEKQITVATDLGLAPQLVSQVVRLETWAPHA